MTTTIKILLIVIAVLFGIIVGLVTGMLSKSGGTPAGLAVRHGGIAFGGSVTLSIGLLTFAAH
ncbi:hypothetical protein ACFXHA_43660 [Nocardia sp. NPDC059240]|uniref:hypothetical protein n=1 Tax=Nocardia sp. NPDC059240 TaxID=3346786 RepID=UPI0036874508